VLFSARELPGFVATVDEVIYMESLEAPPDRPYAFVYFITIVNNSQEPITIKGRKWIIDSPGREKMVVEGDGVVGQYPRILPGKEFSYNSYHVIAKDNTASGAYLAVTDAGAAVVARIPKFQMQVP
jgi:ApaG protein